MFYIAYKSDGITACKKQISLSRLTEVGKTKSNATLYCTPSTENDGAPYRWLYTVEGIPDLLDRANISPYAEPEQIRTILNGMSESQAAQAFPDAAAKLEQIKLAIVNKGWTSNADALFSEICGDFATANAVRLNRAKYKARQKEEEYIIEVKRRRSSVTQGSAHVLVNGIEVADFYDEIKLLKKGEHYYGENIDGWASVTPNESFIKGMLFHPFEEHYHMSEKFRKMLNDAIEETKR